MKKIKEWKGVDLVGVWVFAYKIDGVRVHKTIGNKAVSRSGKPLYNVPMSGTWKVAEVFTGSWESTVSAVRTLEEVYINNSAVYEILPELDRRLFIKTVMNPSKQCVEVELAKALDKGYEGLVLTNNLTGKMLKVKPKKTWDVRIKGVVEGKGKYVGKLGKFITSKGGVGTGFTDKQREEYFTKKMIGKVIEVEAMSLTKDKKFRHPRFLRLREDKS